MRSQVQVLAGPPPIPAGHSAAGSEPGRLVACLGRAGAACPSPPARPLALSGPSTPDGRPHDHHPPWSPTQPEDGSHAAGAATSRAARSRDHSAAAATGAPHAGLACLVAQPSRAAADALTQPRQGPPPTPTDQRATSAASPAPGLLGRRPNRSTARQPTGTRPVPVVTGARRTDLGPTPPPGMGGDGRVRTDEADTSRLDAGRVDTRRAGHRTGGQQTTGPPDTRTTNPGDRTPDGLDTERLDRRIPDDDLGWWTPDAGQRPMPWLASSQCRPGRRRPTAGCRMDAPPGRRPSGRATTQDRSAARTPRAPRCYRPAWLPPRPSAAGGTPPSSRRLGALLSSDDFGSSVGRPGGGHPVYGDEVV